MDRVAKIERELRIWRCGIVVLAIGLLAGAVSIPDEIRAHSFVVVDRKGQKRVWMGVDDARDGSMNAAGFLVKDRLGNLRFSALSDEDRSEMRFHRGFSDNDPDDIFLGAVRNQGNSIALRNGKRSLVSKVQNAEASVEMKDSEGPASLRLSLEMGKKPKLAGTKSDGDPANLTAP